MANNTALRAGKDTTRTITFKNKEHEKFYYTYLPKCRYQDVYHKALVYCLGIDRDTRENAEQIYDFKTGYVKTECLHEGWQTSGSVRIIRLAFNLYCDGTPSVYDYEGDSDRQVDECREYSVSDLFCCGYARYFWEAVKIRYPEYCFYRDWEDLQWFGKLLEQHPKIRVLGVSKPFANKGTNKYFRVYAEIEKRENTMQ